MATVSEASVTDALAATGAEVLTDAESLDFYAHDVYSRGADLAAIVRPSDKQQLAAAVNAATDAGHAVIPRGGGMSYTGGYTASSAGAVLFDMARMDRILAIDETDMTVTVEPGCSWAALHKALSARGLRTPMWGTLSGLKATIGGAMSQNAIFWGTARHGTAASQCLALEVVLANGTLLEVGTSFARPYGPDMVGLFLADTGALGIKASITMRLIREPKANAYASFSFKETDGWFASISEIERAGIATEIFGFDPRLNALRMQRDSLTSDAKQLLGMMKKQAKTPGGVFKAIKEGARVIAAGRSFIDKADFSLHVLAEDRMQAGADHAIQQARDIVASNGGSEVENTIPKIVRANPFGPLNALLGPQGERWAPIHGLLPHSRAAGCFAAIMDLYDEHAEDMEALGIHHGTLTAAVGGAGMIVEPCLYWPDASNPLIEDTIEPAHRQKLPTLEHDEAAWALTQKLKKALIDLLYEHGAVHFQIGRAYRYRDSLSPGADSLLKAIKQELDPRGLMNPGSLGLAASND